MNQKKSPKWRRRMPKYWHKPRVRVLLTIHLIIIVAFAHLLITYPKPNAQVIIMSSKAYWPFFIGLTVFLILLMSYIMLSMEWAYRRKYTWPSEFRFPIFVAIGAVVPLLIVYQLVPLCYHLFAIDDRDYQSLELLWITKLILLYFAWGIYLPAKLSIRRLQFRLEQVQKKRQVDRFARFQPFVDANFMILSEKDHVFAVPYTGAVAPIPYSDDPDWKDLVAFHYIQISRWVYVRKNVIVGIDGKSKQVELRATETFRFLELENTDSILRTFATKGRAKSSVLTLSGSFHAAVKQLIQEQQQEGS